VRYLVSLLICVIFLSGCSAGALDKIRALNGSVDSTARILSAPARGEGTVPRKSADDSRSSFDSAVHAAAIDESVPDRF